MSERRQTIVKVITFTEQERSAMVLSDATKIRLNPEENRVELKPDSSGLFPLTATLNVIGPLASAGAFRAFNGFQALIRHKKVDGAVVTAARFRLTDGVNPYWWNGSAWAVPSNPTTHWNTEDEISSHIATWTQPRSVAGVFGVVVNISTTSTSVTPELYSVKFGVSIKSQSFLEDILYRSLAPDLKTKIRPVTDFLYKQPTAGTTFNLTTALATAGIPFNPIGIDSVFNRTDDPGQLTDLFSSYNPSTKVVTLNTSVAVGKQLQFGLIYEPEVTVSLTHQDFSEVEKVPSLIVHSVEMVGSEAQQGDHVLNKATNVARSVPAPYRGTVTFQLDILAPSGIDLARMADALLEYAMNNPTLASKAIGESYRFFLRDEYSDQSLPSSNDVHTARLKGEIVDVLFFKRSATDEHGVTSIKLTGDLSETATAAQQADQPLGDPTL